MSVRPETPDQDLLAALKSLRLELAREKNVPAYVVFPDATLMEMARERPATLDEMAGINGVGPREQLDRAGAQTALYQHRSGQLHGQ